MYTYIVIDDEPLIRKGTIKKLAGISHIAICIGEAQDGYEALSLIRSANPHIIITDMKMPEMDGTQLLPLLAKEFPRKRIIVTSGYKDFDYMKHAISANAVDYVLKPFGKDDIQNAMRNAIQQIKNQTEITQQIISMETQTQLVSYDRDIAILKNSIMGYHNDSKEIFSEKLKFVNETHNMVLMTMYTTNVFSEKTIGQFLDDNGFGDLALFLQNSNHLNLGFLILFIPEHSPLPIRDLCLQVIRSLNHMFYPMAIPVSFGVSTVHHSLWELHEAFTQTVQALNRMLPVSDEKCYFFEDGTPSANPVSWDKGDEFLFRVEAGMKEEATGLFSQLLRSWTVDNAHSLFECKMYCFWLSDQARLMLQDYLDDINPESANSSMKNVMNSIFSIEELATYYIQYFKNIAEIFNGQKIYAEQNVIEKIKTYINRHYNNNLTIEFVSSIFYLNRSYCSHLFKERTGDTFVNYLNTVRLMNAKKLLIETDKKLYHIAKKAGYTNTKYFFRVFKKYEHMTPEQYRKLHGADTSTENA